MNYFITVVKHREIMCCPRKLYCLIFYEYFTWIENIEASMQIDNPALHVLHVVLSQIFYSGDKNEVFLQFITLYIIEIDYLIMYKILNDMFMIMQYNV